VEQPLTHPLGKDHEIAALRAALHFVMVGGNHLASILINCDGGDFAKRFPPYDDPDTFKEKFLGPQSYDIWICWSAIMRARDVSRGTSQ
jgi:hypothetical protein